MLDRLAIYFLSVPHSKLRRGLDTGITEDVSPPLAKHSSATCCLQRIKNVPYGKLSTVKRREIYIAYGFSGRGQICCGTANLRKNVRANAPFDFLCAQFLP
jgi:hypothetical protein